MASRRDYYFRQKVTEAELDAGFQGLEQADFNIAIDHKLYGINTGLTVSEAAVPDLTVDVALGTAYSKQGERIRVSGTQNVDCSQDDSGTPTTVATPGNTKVVSVFIEFDRALSDPRIDGNSLTVYFVRAESYDFSVVQGAEALIGTEVPPPLDSAKLLLADIRLINGGTTITNAAVVGAYDQIDTTRREDAYKYTGGTVEIIQGTAYTAINSLLTALNNHIDAAANQHPADEVTFVDSATWADSTTLDGATVVDDVQEAIEAVVTDLASQVSGNDGGLKIGKYQSGVWNDGNRLATGSLSSQIDGIVSQLASNTGNGGADKIGAVAQTSGVISVSVGSVYDQIGELVSMIDLINKFPKLVRAQNFQRHVDVMDTLGDAEGICYNGETDSSPSKTWVAVGTNSGAGEIRTASSLTGAWSTETPGGSPTALLGVIRVNASINLNVAVGSNAAGAHIETAPTPTSTWTSRTPTGMTTAGDTLRDAAYDPDKAKIVAVGDRGGTNGNILTSSDGITWAAASVLPAMNKIEAICSDGVDTLVAVGIDGSGDSAALVSVNGGDNWTKELTDTPAGSGFQAVAYDAASARWFIAGDQAHYRSAVNDPTTWEEITGSTLLSLADTSVAADGQGAVIFMGGADCFASVTIDGGETFYHFRVSDATDGLEISSANHLFYQGGYFIALDDTDPDIFHSLLAFGQIPQSITYP